MKLTMSAKMARQLLIGKKHSPTILFVGGIVGAVTSTVLACRATLKLDEVLEETQNDMHNAKQLHDSGHTDYPEVEYKRDMTILYIRTGVKIVKLYGPAVILGASSIAALTGSHKILNTRNAALTAAYATIDKAFGEYRQRVVDELGEDADRQFRYASETRTIVEETDQGPKTSDVVRVAPNTPSGYARFFDEVSPNWSPTPEYNLLFLRCQQNYANDMLKARGHVFLNEVYDQLGLERSKSGAVVGWVLGKDGDNFIDFGVFDGANPRARDFVNGREGSILLDFNVDGVILDKI